MPKTEARRDLTTYSTVCLLEELVKMGCMPGIYYRGRGLWRAHINISGNSWHDGRSPQSAFKGAIKLWRRRNYALDGSAHHPTSSHGGSCATANTKEAF